MLAATGIIMAAGPARAQEMDAPEPERTQLPPGAVVQPLDTGPGAELRRNLTALADNPRSLDALIGAGRAAHRRWATARRRWASSPAPTKSRPTTRG